MRPALTASDVKFRGHSDAEVILESIALRGLDATVQGLVGMIALALWDRRARTLTLVRGSNWYQAALLGEIWRAISVRLRTQGSARPSGLDGQHQAGVAASFVCHNYIPAPRTIYEGVNKLEPGTMLTPRWEGAPAISHIGMPAHRRAPAWPRRSAGLATPISGSDAALKEHI